jgi:hypothetical protein
MLTSPATGLDAARVIFPGLNPLEPNWRASHLLTEPAREGLGSFLVGNLFLGNAAAEERERELSEKRSTLKVELSLHRGSLLPRVLPPVPNTR